MHGSVPHVAQSVTTIKYGVMDLFNGTLMGSIHPYY